MKLPMADARQAAEYNKELLIPRVQKMVHFSFWWWWWLGGEGVY